MLDQDVARALLTIADETKARVALVGDRHQLPAVGRGGVLDHAVRWARPRPTATELRLWDALGKDLLCPFHYFAVADGTDLRRISWTRGRYGEGELSHVYTGNQARAAIVLEQLREKIINPGAMRALGFCVSVAHTHFMAQTFNAAGIPALAVSGDTPVADRQRNLEDLTSRRVNVLFAANRFNEGLDLPDVDTVLFLRPTERASSLAPASSVDGSASSFVMSLSVVVPTAPPPRRSMLGG